MKPAWVRHLCSSSASTSPSWRGERHATCVFLERSALTHFLLHTNIWKHSVCKIQERRHIAVYHRMCVHACMFYCLTKLKPVLNCSMFSANYSLLVHVVAYSRYCSFSCLQGPDTAWVNFQRLTFKSFFQTHDMNKRTLNILQRFQKNTTVWCKQQVFTVS